MSEDYDCLLKFLIVGDEDVGKNEIIAGLDDRDEEFKNHYIHQPIFILTEGKRVKLTIMNVSRSHFKCPALNRRLCGAHGIVLIYDITNKQSFKRINRWLKRVEEYAPDVPKILIGNRLHLEFKREVETKIAESYASRNNIVYFEISPLCDCNIRELFCELARMALHHNGMERIWRTNKVLSLQELCSRTIGKHLSTDDIDTLSLPASIKFILKSFSFKHCKKPIKQRNSCTIM